MSATFRTSSGGSGRHEPQFPRVRGKGATADPHKLPRGRFITFEGGEGAGKSTQARRLGSWLAERGYPVLLTREPGGSPGAELIRSAVLSGDGFDPVAETMLMFAARREHVVATVRPALEAGMWVVCDRFADSTRAYQCFGQGVPGEVFGRLAEFALEGLSPDLTIILDVLEKAGEARRRARGLPADRYERLDANFHARVRAGFLAIAAAEPLRCVVIDAAPGRDVVFEGVQKAVESRLDVVA